VTNRQRREYHYHLGPSTGRGDCAVPAAPSSTGSRVGPVLNHERERRAGVPGTVQHPACTCRVPLLFPTILRASQSPGFRCWTREFTENDKTTTAPKNAGRTARPRVPPLDVTQHAPHCLTCVSDCPDLPRCVGRRIERRELITGLELALRLASSRNRYSSGCGFGVLWCYRLRQSLSG